MKRSEPAGDRPTAHDLTPPPKPIGHVRERLRPSEPGELHPLDRCAFCGARESQEELRRILQRWTASPASVCVDVVACARRSEIRGRAA